MAKIVDYIRSIPGGTGVNSVSVTIKKHTDNTTVSTVTSNSSGQFTYTADGSPGPVYATASTGDRIRVRSGKATGQIGTWFGSDVPVGFRALGDGVIKDYSDYEVTAGNMAVTAGTGLQVLVAEGAALVDGHVYRCTSQTALAISANSSGSTRVDRIVIRFTREGQAEEGKCQLVVSEGVAGSGAPAVQKSSSTWELSLATVSVSSGATGFISANITDTRTYCQQGSAVAITADSTTAFLAEKLDGTDVVAIDTTNKELELQSGTDLIVYSDAGTTEKARIDGATGDITTSGTVTTTRIVGETTILPIILDGGGSVITTGIKVDLPVPYAAKITGWDIMADASGSIVVDLWKDTYANYPPLVADSITAGNKPTLSSAEKNTWTAGTGAEWSVAQGDIIRVNVDTVATVKRVLIALKVKKQ
jgi:hypothetical protein